MVILTSLVAAELFVVVEFQHHFLDLGAAVGVLFEPAQSLT